MNIISETVFARYNMAVTACKIPAQAKVSEYMGEELMKSYPKLVSYSQLTVGVERVRFLPGYNL